MLQDYGEGVFASIDMASRSKVDFAAHNVGITPIFFMEKFLDRAASEEAGAPVYVDLETVRLEIAGDLNTAATHPVDDAIRRRFSDEYSRWKGGVDCARGTSLSFLHGMTPAKIKELSFAHIECIEDLGAVSDGNLYNFRDGRMWRDQAQAHLRERGGVPEAQAGEIADLKAQIEGLKQMIEATLAKPKRRRRTKAQMQEAVA